MDKATLVHRIESSGNHAEYKQDITKAQRGGIFKRLALKHFHRKQHLIYPQHLTFLIELIALSDIRMVYLPGYVIFGFNLIKYAQILRTFKHHTLKSNHLIGLAHNLGLACVGYLIVGAPFQDPLQSMEDLLYLWRNRVLVGVSVYYPAPGSADYEQCQRLNLLPEKISLFRSSALPLDHTTSRLQTVTLLRIGRIVNFMKMLIELGISIPEAETCGQTYISPSTERLETGRMLLKWFFKDGNIRGVDADGQIYIHTAAKELVEKFISEIRGWNS